MRTWFVWVGLAAALAAGGCNTSEGEAQRGSGRGGSPGRGGPGFSQAQGVAAVPVETVSVARRSISTYIETNGTLEAENEVDLMARTAGPIVRLLVEEGMAVQQGQLLAQLDEAELRARLEIAKVNLNEATLAYERAQELHGNQLISTEQYEQAKASFESAEAQLLGDEIQLGYAEIRAPFSGLIITRYVDLAEQVSINTPLFRLSDFDPLLCPIQVPERELSKLRLNQPGYLEVEAWPDQRFDAKVLRISPVVDGATGTIKVTLNVNAEGKLRPGMFARVYLETATKDQALVIPKAALSLESIGDTVYVAENDVAARREVELGYEEGDFVEIRTGLSADANVIVVGQDGLSDGTPIQVLGTDGVPVAAQRQPSGGRAQAGRPSEANPANQPGAGRPAAEGGAPTGEGRPGPRGRPDFANMTPEQLEQFKDRMRERMRARGMSEDEIEQRIEERIRQARGRSQP